MDINTPFRTFIFYVAVGIFSIAFVFGSLTMVACSDFSTFKFPECLQWAWSEPPSKFATEPDCPLQTQGEPNAE